MVKNDNKSLKLKIEELNLSDLNQYSRRENVELKNILESVEQKDLESFVLDLFIH